MSESASELQSAGQTLLSFLSQESILILSAAVTAWIAAGVIGWLTGLIGLAPQTAWILCFWGQRAIALAIYLLGSPQSLGLADGSTASISERIAKFPEYAPNTTPVLKAVIIYACLALSALTFDYSSPREGVAVVSSSEDREMFDEETGEHLWDERKSYAKLIRWKTHDIPEETLFLEVDGSDCRRSDGEPQAKGEDGFIHVDRRIALRDGATVTVSCVRQLTFKSARPNGFKWECKWWCNNIGSHGPYAAHQ